MTTQQNLQENNQSESFFGESRNCLFRFKKKKKKNRQTSPEGLEDIARANTIWEQLTWQVFNSF